MKNMLSMEEFKSKLVRCGIPLSDKEKQVLYQVIRKITAAGIEPNEFLSVFKAFYPQESLCDIDLSLKRMFADFSREIKNIFSGRCWEI